ncbi:MAG: ketopantoate reductase family protein [Candidatus Thorarchaeota archaeon]
MSTINSLKVVIYGIGGIGATLGGWLTQGYDNVYLLARGDNAKVLKSNGLILYKRENNNPTPIPVKVIEDLNELTNIEVVIITVKNYDLEEVAKDIFEKLGDNPIIVGLQNGFENQRVLPKYFTKIVYGVVVQSGWRDEPGIFGTQGKGHLTLGTPNNENQEIVEKVAELLNISIPTRTTKVFQDAAHSKLIINLSNSVYTIISPELKDDNAIFNLWRIFVNVYLEGVVVVKMAGYKEFELKGLPSWKAIELGKNLDKITAVNNFKKGTKYAWLNSMAQDMIRRQKSQSELESLNGYLLKLADSLNIKVPYNQTIYKLCKENFNRVPYQPLPVEVVWQKINEELNKK